MASPLNPFQLLSEQFQINSDTFVIRLTEIQFPISINLFFEFRSLTDQETENPSKISFILSGSFRILFTNKKIYCKCSI